MNGTENRHLWVGFTNTEQEQKVQARKPDAWAAPFSLARYWIFAPDVAASMFGIRNKEAGISIFQEINGKCLAPLV
jgi:hypothetical protein